MALARPSHEDTSHLTDSLRQYLEKWVNCEGSQPRMTECGLCFLQKWGSLRYSMTTALLAAIYASASAGTE
jgi:hypothetical protein